MRESEQFYRGLVLIRPLLKGILLCCVCLRAQQAPVAFIDVTVVPMDSERLVPHATVVVRDGRIAAAGPARSVRVPKGTQRIDGRGKFLMPGLADMHVHFNIRGSAGLLKNDEFATLFIANGVTTVRNMWGNPDILAFRKSIEQGKVVGPQIYTTGPLTDGNPPVRPSSRVVETVSQATDAVTSDKRDGYDAVKVYNKLSPEVYQTIVSTARTLGLPVWGHVPERVGIEEVLAARQDSIEHVAGYLEALDRDGSPSKVSELVSATCRAGTWNCLTLVFFQGAVPVDVASRLLSKPSMRFVPPALRDGWKNNRQLASLTAYQFGRLRLYDEKRIEFVRALLGTDTPNQFIVPGFAVHEELRNLVDAGFTPYAAIDAATRGAAQFLKSQDQWGTIAVGLRADLILLHANPLEDVGNVSRRAGVMVRGRWLAEEELHGSLERLASSYVSAAPGRSIAATFR
jgi:imidazolonepropionase-like amidohydrolase